MYLMKYGYMDLNGKDPKKSSSLVSTSGLAAYIEEFQAFSNLTVTGELDEETLAMMKRPRCGVKDVVGHGSSREKRYALQGWWTILRNCHTHHFVFQVQDGK